MTGRRLRRRKQLMGDIKEKRGYWEYKEEALIFNLWRNGFGRISGPAVRQIIKCLNIS